MALKRPPAPKTKAASKPASKKAPAPKVAAKAPVDPAAPKRGRGRPQFVPTETERAQVEALVSYGIALEHIVMLITRNDKPIAINTLKKHFERELAVGPAKANMLVAQSLFKMATDTKHKQQFQAAKFWLQVRAGWTMQTAGDLDLAQLLAGATDAELAALEGVLKRGVGDNVVPFSRRA